MFLGRWRCGKQGINSKTLFFKSFDTNLILYTSYKWIVEKRDGVRSGGKEVEWVRKVVGRRKDGEIGRQESS